ncbi:MAG: PEGA domain-containing protein [Elusimicrobium sp.]|nr:PEGA domain-containing protein [Elusimicrobium sp.]
MEKTTMKAIAAILSLSVTAGCSCFVGTRERVTVMTNISDAAIYANGSKVGNGTANFYAKKNKNVQIMAKADGYETAYHQIEYSLSTTGILDIVGAVIFLIPLIGLLTPGAQTLDENNVALDLEPIRPQAQTN